MAEELKFEVGNQVVYPAHGVGKITDEETQTVGGYEVRVYVISFTKDKMTLRVPVNRAASAGLRHLSTKEDIKKVILILKMRPKSIRGMWSRRAQEYEAKINSGNITSIAEVVRDLHKNVDDPDRSYSERMIYESALGRLVGEYAAIENLDIDKATEALVSNLAPTKAKEAQAALEEEEAA